MGRIGFVGLAVAAVISSVLVVATAELRMGVRPSDVAGELLFPHLTDRLNTLRSVVVKHKGHEVALDLNGATWVARDRDGYPADAGKIASLVVQLAQMTRVEAKTRLPEKYGRLNLGDPDSAESGAKEVRLMAGNGKSLASLIVGKQKFSLGADGRGVYVRLPDDPQTWLARAEIDPAVSAGGWLDPDIVDIRPEMITGVTVTHPAGGKIRLVRPKSGGSDFELANIPRGKEVTSAYALNEIAGVLSSLTLEDVARPDKVAFTPKNTITAVYECRNGMRVTIEIVDHDGKTWLKIAADSDVTGDVKAAEARQLAAQIALKGENWVFRVAGYEVSALKKRMSDLVSKGGSASRS